MRPVPIERIFWGTIGIALLWLLGTANARASVGDLPNAVLDYYHASTPRTLHDAKLPVLLPARLPPNTVAQYARAFYSVRMDPPYRDDPTRPGGYVVWYTTPLGSFSVTAYAASLQRPLGTDQREFVEAQKHAVANASMAFRRSGTQFFPPDRNGCRVARSVVAMRPQAGLFVYLVRDCGGALGNAFDETVLSMRETSTEPRLAPETRLLSEGQRRTLRVQPGPVLLFGVNPPGMTITHVDATYRPDAGTQVFQIRYGGAGATITIEGSTGLGGEDSPASLALSLHSRVLGNVTIIQDPQLRACLRAVPTSQVYENNGRVTYGSFYFEVVPNNISVTACNVRPRDFEHALETLILPRL